MGTEASLACGLSLAHPLPHSRPPEGPLSPPPPRCIQAHGAWGAARGDRGPGENTVPLTPRCTRPLWSFTPRPNNLNTVDNGVSGRCRAPSRPLDGSRCCTHHPGPLPQPHCGDGQIQPPCLYLDDTGRANVMRVYHKELELQSTKNKATNHPKP